MALWRLYYHVIWATRERQAMILPHLQDPLYSYILKKAASLECIPHAIGGIEDHLHLLVSIPPKHSIADFVRHVKGSSAHYLNHTIQADGFAWQHGYGVFSLGGRQLPTAIRYVQQQKEHHRQGTTIPALEQDQEDTGDE
ncbi:MAG: IS200/IS605 family transposase [Herpetosiphonaceae bacterium]|nr:IS200/IS605 family transposase [Herpetosiphonaceae bacterium]